MYQPPNNANDTTQAHQPSQTSLPSSVQSSTRIRTARVRLLPLMGWSQPPLPPATAQSGTFQSPPIPPGRPNIWRRYQSLNRFTQVGIWCLVASLTLFLFVCSLAAIAGLKMQTTANQGVATIATTQASTPTVALNQGQPTQVQSSPTAVPPTPTQAYPTPTPTLAYPTPTPIPQAITPKPAQPTRPLTGVNGNPWGYDFAKPGKVITDPPTGFCSGQYFRCTKRFSDGDGYVVQCNDGLYSRSGGQDEVCSRHGGYKRTLYSH